MFVYNLGTLLKQNTCIEPYFTMDTFPGHIVICVTICCIPINQNTGADVFSLERLGLQCSAWKDWGCSVQLGKTGAEVFSLESVNSL